MENAQPFSPSFPDPEVAPPPIPSANTDRALGRRLAERLEPLGTTSPQRLRLLLPNLLGEDSTLSAPLHDLVGRPGFGLLLAAGGNPSRFELRDQLLQELAETYSAGMTARLGAVLDGLLEPRTAAKPRAVAGNLSAHPRTRTQQPPAARRSARRRPGGMVGLVVLTAVVSLGSGLLFALLRSNFFCPSLGLCLASEAGAAAEASIETGLRQAERAASLVNDASSLEDFGAGLQQLDSALLNLVSRRLSPRQERKRQRLQEQADQAHRRLREEQRAQRSLEEAEALIAVLERSSAAGPQRLDALAEVRARLDEVSGNSFARSSLGALERRLEAVQALPAEPEREPPKQEKPFAEPPASPAGESPPVAAPKPSAARPEGGRMLPAPPPPPPLPLPPVATPPAGPPPEPPPL